MSILKEKNICQKIFFVLIILFSYELKTQTKIIEINSLNPELIKLVESDSLFIKVLTKSNFQKIKKMSDYVIESDGTLTAVKDTLYLNLETQMKLINDVIKYGLRKDIKLIILDLLTQYFFLTYYYSNDGDFIEPYKSFLKNLKVEYKFLEQANQNLYQHTFLLKFVLSNEQSYFYKYYKNIYQKTNFDETPKGD